MRRKNIEDIERFADRIKVSAKEASNKRRTWRTRKLLGVPLPMALMILGSIVVSAILITGFTSFSIYMEDDIELIGVEGSMFYFDDQLITSTETTIDFDIGNLSANETKYSYHNISSDENDGDWNLTFTNSSADFVNDPTHMYYGFNVSLEWWNGAVWHNQDAPDIVPVLHGETVPIRLIFYLHPDFQQLQDPVMPFNMTISAVKM